MADTAPVHSNPSAPIPVTHARINGVEQACVQARLLHQYLQNPIGFLDWFRVKTETLGLVCHRHYEPSVQALAGEAAPQQNFLLTLSAAIVLTAAENSDRGQQLCRYLIAAVSQQDVPLPSQPSSASSTSPCITSDQTQRLQKLAKERMRHTGLPFQTVWTELKHRFGIHSYHNLPSDQFEAACQFLCRPRSVPTAGTSLQHSSSNDVFQLPDAARQVMEEHSFQIVSDSLPLVRLFLSSYLRRHANPSQLHDPQYVTELLSTFQHIESCFDWFNGHC